MYQAHYINPLKQFGWISFDLLIDDDNYELRSYRISKSFPDTFTEQDAADYANNLIAGVLSMQDPPMTQIPIVPIIDMPPEG